MLKRKMKAVVGGVMASIILPVNVLAAPSMAIANIQSDATEEASTRIIVSKHVKIELRYATIAAIPELYPYSYYDHDYSTTLRGTLVLYDTVDFKTYVMAYYSGNCSASI
ncbi:MAG TPA: hypothetical protein IAC62_10870 [Candidatus Pelethocola excrementipullorum]|nr:hypothetical protein [Candidatus Pelethocola excrementipullorum]